MGVNKTSLSAGELIYGALSGNPEVCKRAGNIYPIVEDKAVLPYIVYRRVSLDQRVTKDNRRNDSVVIEIDCYTEKYLKGVELAEAVRSALDRKTISDSGFVMRSCELTGASEDWLADAFIQHLEFTCRM